MADKAELPIITTSRLRDGRGCKRLHRYKYELGFRPNDDEEAPRFGTLIHRGLEAWWNGWRLPGAERLDAALKALAERGPGEEPPGELDAVKAEELLRGYHYRWLGEPYEVLAVEASFTGPLLNPLTGAASRTWRLGGKIDAIARDRRDGLVRIVEHKTSSEDVSPGSDYWKRLRLDGQVSIYYEGAGLLGHDVAGCLYDVIRKPTIRPCAVPLLDGQGVKIVLDAAGERVRTKDGKKWRETGDSAQGWVLQTRPETAEEYRVRLVESIASNPIAYFSRAEVVRLEAEMKEAMHDTWTVARELRDAELDGVAPRNPDFCVRYGYTCPFFGVCTGEASLDDASLFHRVASVHPELAGQAGGAQPKEVAA